MQILTGRYIYATFSTAHAAYYALEDMFAAGEVAEWEQPRVERIGFGFAITMQLEAAL